jgi:RNA polymerase sigma-70 factor, ECF subfamily
MNVQEAVDAAYRQDGGRMLATLIGKLGDFELAQDVLQEAAIAALEHWQTEGVPTAPAAWLITTARRKAIDRLRRIKTLASKQPLLARLVEEEYHEVTPESDPFPDEWLKLMFTCCHPALGLETQVALTLQTLGGLTTPEIAAAFLVPEPTMAQRLVRAKRKIRDAGIPYAVPNAHNLGQRLEGVQAVIYLIFNAGYAASLGENWIKHNLCAEAIRLCRALLSLLENDRGIELSKRDRAETHGLLALMLLHDARREARTGTDGTIILLEEQDRTRWNRAQIAEGVAILDKAVALRSPGAYQLQAAISALHSEAATPEATDWLQIALLYAELVKHSHTPVVRLNWAVAVAMASTPQKGLDMLAQLEKEGSLTNYYLFYAARADLLRRAGKFEDARTEYRRALRLTQNHAVQIFLNRRLAETDTEQN